MESRQNSVLQAKARKGVHSQHQGRKQELVLYKQLVLSSVLQLILSMASMVQHSRTSKPGQGHDLKNKARTTSLLNMHNAVIG